MPRLHAVSTWQGVQTGQGQQPRERLPLTPWVWIVLWVSCSSGFINGFANSSGLLAFMSEPFLHLFFPQVAGQAFLARLFRWETGWPSQVQYCIFRDDTMGLYNAVHYIALVATVPVAAWVCTCYGRKAGVGVGAVAYVVGTALMAVAFSLGQLYAGSVVVGISQAFLHMTMAIEAIEVAPAAHRGAFGGSIAAAYTAGLSCGVILFLAPMVRHAKFGWRIPCALASWMGLVMLALLYWLPETPSSLVQRGNMTEARDALKAIRGELYPSAAIEGELLDIFNGCRLQRCVIDASERTCAVLIRQLRLLFGRSQLPILLLLSFLCLVKEVSGPLTTIHVVPLLLGVTKPKSYLLVACAMGGACTAGSVLGLFMSDVKFLGRRASLAIGAGVCAALNVATALLMCTFDQERFPQQVLIAALSGIFLVYGAFGGILQALFAVVMPENLPLSTRPAGVGICLLVYYVTRILVHSTIAIVLCRTEWGFFLFLCAAHLGIVLVAWVIPEARGVPLDRVPALWQKHPLWGHWIEVQQQPAL